MFEMSIMKRDDGVHLATGVREIQRVYREWRKRRQAERLLAVAMASHTRLADSTTCLLGKTPEDIIRQIMVMAC